MCNQQRPWSDSIHPAQLIEIQLLAGLRGVPKIHLVDTRPGHMYECLSHRWDEAVNDDKTTLYNLTERTGSIKLSELSENFRDMVIIARELDIKHIWIDSKCIIQDCDDGRDLGRETAKMRLIYPNAQSVVAVVSPPDSGIGCFVNNRWLCKCLNIEVSNGQTHNIGARVLDGMGQIRDVTDLNKLYPLRTRAWAFQERLLSTRLLECN